MLSHAAKDVQRPALPTISVTEAAVMEWNERGMGLKGQLRPIPLSFDVMIADSVSDALC